MAEIRTQWRPKLRSVQQHKRTQALYSCLRVAMDNLSSSKTSRREPNANEACASRRRISAEDRAFGVRTDPR